ncbi:hypothetical protein PsYK624_128880 [Phanerochaete sordida]|uniref:Uncharacterized protein n=1 Tax=Phanerochaete sordida TaxID=48140 RepID=A0A9P3LIT9_9APHY|nr:hypothetical protein PsYK624_128880 [Phanerochaete sordida]
MAAVVVVRSHSSKPREAVRSAIVLRYHASVEYSFDKRSMFEGRMIPVFRASRCTFVTSTRHALGATLDALKTLLSMQLPTVWPFMVVGQRRSMSYAKRKRMLCYLASASSA